MASPELLLSLEHILDNIGRILRWTKGLTMEAYLGDMMLRDAVERCLERVSEASRRLPAELKASQPQVPWRKVADIGNVLRHEYHDVADSEIWRIVVDDLEPLEKAVKAMIEAT